MLPSSAMNQIGAQNMAVKSKFLSTPTEIQLSVLQWCSGGIVSIERPKAGGKDAYNVAAAASEVDMTARKNFQTSLLSINHDIRKLVLQIHPTAFEKQLGSPVLFDVTRDILHFDDLHLLESFIERSDTSSLRKLHIDRLAFGISGMRPFGKSGNIAIEFQSRSHDLLKLGKAIRAFGSIKTIYLVSASENPEKEDIRVGLVAYMIEFRNMWDKIWAGLEKVGNKNIKRWDMPQEYVCTTKKKLMDTHL
ncbi:uncharacterized protein LY89DRAFT_785180 [Mollisia scopiformis]|uniref:Uncharacterized protein n=1 Tax=Mollisia scopiformis TaxID=149040 RepID=A0A194X0L3_MOLSC|nr:uncharacterized protein LY89DRAFT_785180 [Mollisia scopiformis]KUJ13494.1 hypothetical protein LY89DRAFT_785180 [Mollisia scopiformis]